MVRELKDFKLKLKERFLLDHEYIHAEKMAEFQDKYKPYIVLGVRGNTVIIGMGEKQWMKYDYIYYKKGRKGNSYKVYITDEWKQNKKRSRTGFTDISDRQELKFKQVSEAAYAPYRKDLLGFAAGFILPVISIGIFFEPISLYTNSELVRILTYLSILAYSIVFLIIKYLPNTFPLAAYRTAGHDYFFHFFPAEFYTYGRDFKENKENQKNDSLRLKLLKLIDIKNKKADTKAIEK